MQKFKLNDHVMIAADLGKAMSHFISNREAIVLYSYKDKYREGSDKSYGIFIKGHGEVAWYYEEQLTLIAASQAELLEAWKKERDDRDVIHADIDWIFAHGLEVLARRHAPSVATLASNFGITNLWGTHGEDIDYWRNTHKVLLAALPYLITDNKTGWMQHCAILRYGSVKLETKEDSHGNIS